MKYQKQIEGPCKIILVKDDAKILNARKHFIRENFAQKLMENTLTGLMVARFYGIQI